MSGVHNFPSGYDQFEVKAMAYDPERDGVWIDNQVFLPRNVIIWAIGLLSGEPPKAKATK